ncbi:MAG: ribosome small subunit-dependent GTPase A [Clostridiales bacterium]|nr:ribosome small subunit-dependent GTPase A [Clostridiales bacterium]
MIDLKLYGYTENEKPPLGLLPGRITEQQRELYTVITANGEVTAALTGSFYHSAKTSADIPCTGDFVFLRYNSSGPSLIMRLLPRRSVFSRADFSGHTAEYAKTVLEQLVAANFDFVFILSSLNKDFKISRITRYLTQAWQSGGQPVVILTKADLVEDIKTPVSAVQQGAIDVPVHALSVHTGFGLDALKGYLLPGKTAVFIGMSGVGKSSLLNTLMGQDVMAVKAIREDDSRGRHATTHRQLFMLPSGALVIDTPGMRELGLFGADNGISVAFARVEELFGHCRFSDCHHQSEPGCAVIAALKDGSLSRERWESYLSHKRETAFVESKADFLREKGEWQKSIAKFSKQYKKGPKR